MVSSLEPKAWAIQKEQNIQNYLSSLFYIEFVLYSNKQLMIQQEVFSKYQFHIWEKQGVSSVESCEKCISNLDQDH